MLPTASTIIDNRYEIVRDIGVGGMGLVYEVQGLMLQNRFAMKLLKPDLAQHELIRERFWREAKLQSTIDHPNIVKVYDLISVQGVPAIILEFLDGVNLADFLDAGERLTIEQVRRIAREIASGLDAAHAIGTVHRDLKPDNIFLVAGEGKKWTPKLLDFGVAKVFDDTRLTVTDAFVGTYRYASPEQVLDSTNIDARSDLYSLGVVLWELLTNEIPYSHVSGNYAIQNAVLNESLGPLPDHTPPDLEAVIRKLLFKEVELRIQSAAGLIAALDGNYDEDVDRAVAEERIVIEPEIVDLEPPPPPVNDTQPDTSEMEPESSYPQIRVSDLRLEKQPDYATAVRDEEVHADLRYSTAAYEAVVSNRRAPFLLALLLFIVAGVIAVYAYQAAQDRAAEIEAAGSGQTDERSE